MTPTALNREIRRRLDRMTFDRAADILDAPETVHPLDLTAATLYAESVREAARLRARGLLQ